MNNLREMIPVFQSIFLFISPVVIDYKTSGKQKLTLSQYIFTSFNSARKVFWSPMVLFPAITPSFCDVSVILACTRNGGHDLG